MLNPWILSETLRPISAEQFLRRHQFVQQFIVVNRTSPDHPKSRLALRTHPHDTAAFLASIGCHLIARIGGARESLVGAGEEFELEFTVVSWSISGAYQRTFGDDY